MTSHKISEQHHLKHAFLTKCRQDKNIKLKDTVTDIKYMEDNVQSLFNRLVTDHPKVSAVTFQRQGKFRYWFKELYWQHSVNSKNILEELCHTILQYTAYNVRRIPNSVIASTKKVEVNCTGALIAGLNNKLVLAQPSQLTVAIDSIEGVTDFSWSKQRQSELSSVLNEKELCVRNVMEGVDSFSAQGLGRMCCVASCKFSHNLCYTSGENFIVWDKRQESSAASTCIKLSPCLGRSVKGKCISQGKDEHHFIVCTEPTKISIFDVRSLKSCVSSFLGVNRNIMAVDSTQDRILATPVRGRSRIWTLSTPHTPIFSFEGLSSITQPSILPCGFFVSTTSRAKISLYSKLLRKPMLSVVIDGSVVSHCYNNRTQKLFVNSGQDTFIVSFH